MHFLKPHKSSVLELQYIILLLILKINDCTEILIVET